VEEPIVRVRPNYHEGGIKLRKTRIDWIEQLASVVAWGHYCRILVHPGTSMVTFVGKETDARTAAQVYEKLFNAAESIADKEYVKFFYDQKKLGDQTKARGFRTSFLIGFCRRIGQRYAEYVEALKNYYAHDQKALVVIKDSRQKVDEWMKDVKSRKEEPKMTPITNRAGYLKGVDRANAVSLTGAKEIG
jgi:hypothetical protein